MERLRDAAGLVVGCFLACRRAELVRLNVADVTAGPAEVVFRFWVEKARQPVVAGPLEARRVVWAHPLLVAAMKKHRRKFGVARLAPAHPLFCSLGTRRAGRLRSAWVSRVVRSAAPGATTHWLRVGFATEASAAGCSVAKIRAVGRWTSDAAVLYISGSADAQAAASRRVGSAGLRMDEALVRDAQGAHGRLWRVL